MQRTISGWWKDKHIDCENCERYVNVRLLAIITSLVGARQKPAPATVTTNIRARKERDLRLLVVTILHVYEGEFRRGCRMLRGLREQVPSLCRAYACGGEYAGPR